jgi:hypothetical protein
VAKKYIYLHLFTSQMSSLSLLFINNKIFKKNEMNINHLDYCIIIIMNARSIIDIFKRVFFTQAKTPLGRWNIHNYSQTTLKIRYANEDNCGTCGEHNRNITQMLENNGYNENQELDELYIYMMGSETLPDNMHIRR